MLIESGHARTAKKYILYRDERTRVREMNTRLMKVYEDLTFKSSIENDIKRENANIDGDTAMGTMLKYGSEGAKQFYEMFILDPAHAAAHRDGDIHIHDLDFLTLTTTCCQIDLLKLFRDGFSTGHGFLREPNDIRSYAALACIAISQPERPARRPSRCRTSITPWRGRARPSWLFRSNLAKALEVFGEDDNNEVDARELTERVEKETGKWACLAGGNGYDEAMAKALSESLDEKTVAKCMKFARKYADKETRKGTYQAMEALVHNLNHHASIAGAQIRSPSAQLRHGYLAGGRLVMRNGAAARGPASAAAGTPIFPIHIFQGQGGVPAPGGGGQTTTCSKLTCTYSQAKCSQTSRYRRAVRLARRPSGTGRLRRLPHASCRHR